jgi:hypothetical protein
MDSVQGDARFHAIGKKVTIDAPTAGAFYQITDVKIKAVSIVVCHGRESLEWVLVHFPVTPWLVQSIQIASLDLLAFMISITG